MLKRYNVSLEEGPTEELRKMLEKDGNQSLSSFLSSMIVEYVDTMKNFRSENPTGDVSKITVAQVLRLFSGLFADMSKGKNKKL